jgi:hypothetical protein
MLCLDENIELLKLRSLIDMSNLVPAREHVSRNDERVLILENPEKQYISSTTRILVVVFGPTVGHDSHYSDRSPISMLFLTTPNQMLIYYSKLGNNYFHILIVYYSPSFLPFNLIRVLLLLSSFCALYLACKITH